MVRGVTMDWVGAEDNGSYDDVFLGEFCTRSIL